MSHPEKYNTPPPVFVSVLTERYSSNNSHTFAQLHDEESDHVWGTMCGFKYSWKSPLQLVNFEELPDWVKDNEFVKTCHRSCIPMKQALKSVFQVHCETGNIWTHLLATLYSVWLCVYTLPRMQTTETLIAMSLYFFGSTSVYICSTLFHTLFVCSASISIFVGKIDYIGIILGIWGCLTSVIMLMFPCPQQKWTFIGLVSLLGLICLIIIVFGDKLQSPSLRVCRTLMFALFGLFGLAPIFAFLTTQKACFNEGNPCGAPVTNITMFLGAMGASFLGGAALYAARVPERWWPGMFDIVGHSHQIWHVAIVGGFTFHYFALCELVANLALLSTECSA